jgi:histidine ammonia-lyase
MDTMRNIFRYGIDELTISKTFALIKGETEGVLTEEAIYKIKQSETHVRNIVEQETTVYGINTGFGILAQTRISTSDTIALQHKILQSHSVGVGNAVPTLIAKAMLITKLHALARGFSGIRLETLERIIWHIREEIIPVVPEKGSVGASGDLAPLAHLFLPLIGLGELQWKNKTYPSQKLLAEFGLKALTLGPKEGLALINGTQFILSYALTGVIRMHNALEAADIIGAMSLEALTGTKAPFDKRLHELRPFEGINSWPKDFAYSCTIVPSCKAILIAEGSRIPIRSVVCLRFMALQGMPGSI